MSQQRKHLHSIHVAHHKNTDKCETVVMPVPSEVCIPMSMHIGAPCKPLVAKGDTVKVGQLIGDTDAFVSAPIHSSVSGTVKAIEPRTLATGGKCNAIIIENDGEYEEVMAPINSALHCPTHNEIHQKNIEFWFTETGYRKFQAQIHKLLELYQKYAPNYIKEWDVLEQEIKLTDPNIKYKDVSNVCGYIFSFTRLTFVNVVIKLNTLCFFVYIQIMYRLQWNNVFHIGFTCFLVYIIEV